MANRIILTNMCMLYKEDHSFLVINRLKKDWPGINFPGGHVEANESVEESVIREMKEETGLNVHSLEFVTYYEWNMIEEGVRHLCLLFRSKDFDGTLKSSSEGKVFFIKKDELSHHLLSIDFDKILELASKDIFYFSSGSG